MQGRRSEFTIGKDPEIHRAYYAKAAVLAIVIRKVLGRKGFLLGPPLPQLRDRLERTVPLFFLTTMINNNIDSAVGELCDVYMHSQPSSCQMSPKLIIFESHLNRTLVRLNPSFFSVV